MSTLPAQLRYSWKEVVTGWKPVNDGNGIDIVLCEDGRGFIRLRYSKLNTSYNTNLTATLPTGFTDTYAMVPGSLRGHFQEQAGGAAAMPYPIQPPSLFSGSRVTCITSEPLNLTTTSNERRIQDREGGGLKP